MIFRWTGKQSGYSWVGDNEVSVFCAPYRRTEAGIAVRTIEGASLATAPIGQANNGLLYGQWVQGSVAGSGRYHVTVKTWFDAKDTNVANVDTCIIAEHNFADLNKLQMNVTIYDTSGGSSYISDQDVSTSEAIALLFGRNGTASTSLDFAGIGLDFHSATPFTINIGVLWFGQRYVFDNLPGILNAEPLAAGRQPRNLTKFSETGLPLGTYILSTLHQGNWSFRYCQPLSYITAIQEAAELGLAALIGLPSDGTVVVGSPSLPITYTKSDIPDRYHWDITVTGKGW